MHKQVWQHWHCALVWSPYASKHLTKCAIFNVYKNKTSCDIDLLGTRLKMSLLCCSCRSPQQQREEWNFPHDYRDININKPNESSLAIVCGLVHCLSRPLSQLLSVDLVYMEDRILIVLFTHVLVK